MKTSDFSYVDPKQQTEHDKKTNRIIYFGTNGCVGHYPLGINFNLSKEEQTELRQMFCSNGFSLATAYRAAMTYLRQDISDGKAVITNNGEILRK